MFRYTSPHRLRSVSIVTELKHLAAQNLDTRLFSNMMQTKADDRGIKMVNKQYTIDFHNTSSESV